MNAPVIRVEHRQQQAITPRLQQAVRLLQLSSLDFAHELREVMGKNPFLEQEEPTDADQEVSDNGERRDDFDAPSLNDTMAASAPAVEPADAMAQTVDEAATMSGDAESDTAWERDSWQADGNGSRPSSNDSAFNIFDTMPADVNLRQHLREQANLRHLSDRDRALVGSVIESLDDDGYLRMALHELASMVELDPAVDESEMRMALKLVQSLEPSGVGARSIAECLQLQLHLIDDKDQQALAREIIEHHLERLAHRDGTGLAKLLGRPLDEVEAVCERVRHMDPRPGWRYGSADIHYVTPDVIVRKVRNKWTAALNPAVVPRVRLNQVYADLFKQHRDGQHSELASHLQEARWTVRNVEQRFATILAVAEAILKRQHHFLEFGPLAMKPLGLREIAEEVGLHESTVSRVTNNKYMATPVGVFELKYFFSRAMPMQSGGTCSATAIRGLIKDMIDAEDGSRPLSDVDIARQLTRQGLTVARRTVTKYRQLLKLPAVEQRRRHAA